MVQECPLTAFDRQVQALKHSHTSPRFRSRTPFSSKYKLQLTSAHSSFLPWLAPAPSPATMTTATSAGVEQPRPRLVIRISGKPDRPLVPSTPSTTIQVTAPAATPRYPPTTTPTIIPPTWSVRCTISHTFRTILKGLSGLANGVMTTKQEGWCCDYSQIRCFLHRSTWGYPGSTCAICSTLIPPDAVVPSF